MTFFRLRNLIRHISFFFVLVILPGPLSAQDLITKKRCGGLRFIEDASLLRSSKSDAKKLVQKNDQGIELKVSTRKKDFRPNDLVTFSLALLNSTGAPLFTLVPDSRNVNIYAVDANGVTVNVGTYEVSQVGVSPRMYNLVNPGFFSTGWVNMHAGCEKPDAYTKRKSEILNGLLERPSEEMSKILLENGLFQYWGEYCLDLKRAGKFKFVFELKRSDHVVTFPGCQDSTVKTLVTSIRSNPVFIDIVD